MGDAKISDAMRYTYCILHREDTLPKQFSQGELKQATDENRRAQQAFIARGLASLEAAKKSGEYISSEEVLRMLDEKIASAKKKAKK